MTIREIVWTLSADGRSITPNIPQDGGQQGEHNVTKVVFNIPAELAAENTRLYIGCVDCTGGYDKSPVLTVENGKVAFLLPRAWTQFGGTSVLTLTEEGADAIAYAAKARVVYHSRQDAIKGERRLIDGFMQAACDAAAESAERAREDADTAVAAANAAANAAVSANAAKTAAEQYAEHAAEMAEDVAGDLAVTNQHREAAENAAGATTAAAKTAATSAEEARKSAASADDSATRAENAATAAAISAQEAAAATDALDEALTDYINHQCVHNVRDFGAVGDGDTDDTEAIQTALHFAEETGEPLYFPAGNYKVSKTITTYTRDTDADKQSKALHIYGSGMGTVFTATKNFEGDYVFHIDVKREQPRMLWVHDFAIDLVADVSGIYFEEIGMKSVVEDLWITFKSTKQDGAAVRTGIWCEESTVATFQRIKIQGNLHDPLRTRNCGIVLRRSFTTEIVYCDIIYCGWAVYINGGSNNTIDHCRIDENEYGVFQNASEIFEVENKAYPEISFKGTLRNLTIRNNRFECNNVCSIFLAAYGTGDLHYMYNHQVTIANNDFSGLGAGTARYSGGRAVFRKAMRLYHCKGVTIAENSFAGKPYDESNAIEGVSYDENEANRLSQNITGMRTEDITFRGNVATAGALVEKNEAGEWVPILNENGKAIIRKTNPKIDPSWLNYSHEVNQPVSLAEQGITDNIEADQSTRCSLGDIPAALDSIIAIQEGLIGGDAE